MLAVASPISLPSPTNFSRSSKDKDGLQQHPRGSGIDAILKDKVEFVEGSSTGTLVQAETKYPYINGDNSRVSQPISPSKSLPVAPPSSLHIPDHSLHNRPLVTSWITNHVPRAGFINTGNTCFLNSVLQCLIHTAPLQRLLQGHGQQDDQCRVTGPFCMACNLRTVMVHGFQKTNPFVPNPVVKNLKYIAKHMRHGRQEDAHEFLRYTVDALQHACLAGYSSKLDAKLHETTWVHKLFGGRLRSRVTCNSCTHPSDTFDAILDLSLDIQNVSSVKQALAKFVQIDLLRGANKYKCERCKRPVNAEKQFTIHDAPMCLTVHLKRFTPLGRKIGHTVEYSHLLDLLPAMSEGQHGPRYSLYGVISHAGSGPNSGHYYAHVKGPDGSWYEANDESVVHCSASSVIGRKNAYMLFYMRQQGDALGEAINLHGSGLRKNGAKHKLVIESDDEDQGVPANGADISPPTSQEPKTFIGPRLPSPAPSLPIRPDPQAIALRTKIAKAKAAAKSAAPKPSLVPYSSDAEEEGEVCDAGVDTTPLHRAPSPPSSSTVAPRTSSPIPIDLFYGNSLKKRKGSDGINVDAKRRRPSPPEESRPPKRSLGTPFTSSSMSNNLHASRDHEFNPPNRTPKQKIAGVGTIGYFRPHQKGYASKMKTRMLV